MGPPTRTCKTKHGDVVLGTLDEVLAIPKRYLNDHCLIQHDDTWHLFAIHGDIRTPENPFTDESSIFHATSPDLHDWTIHPSVVERSGNWPELGCVYAPHVIAHDDRFFMLYCANDELGTQATQSLSPLCHGQSGLASASPTGVKHGNY